MKVQENESTQAGLLALPVLSAFPFRYTEQWLGLTAPGFYSAGIGITVAGPLRILTGIP